MKKINILFSVMLCLFGVFLFSCDTSENVVPRTKAFVKLYGNDGNQIGVDFAQLNNGDLIILARVQRLNNHFMLVRVDTAGNEKWKTEYKHDNVSLNPAALTIDENANIIVTGTAITQSTSDIFIYKVSPAAGDVIDSKINFNTAFPNDNDSRRRIDVAQDVVTFTNNSYIVSGYTRVGQNTTEEFFSFRINQNLDTIGSWFKVILPYSDQNEEFSRVENRILPIGGNQVLALTTTSEISEGNAKQGTNLEIIRLDATGNAAGARIFAGTDFNERLAGLAKTSSGFAYIGTIQNTASTSLLIGELTGNGSKSPTPEINFSKKTSLKAIDIAQGQIGRLLILAEETVSSDNRNIYLAEIDNFGKLYWEHAYGGDDIDQAAALLVDDNSIYILGTLKLESQNKILLIKTDLIGRL